MSDPTARALHLLGLLQSRVSWTAAELAANLDVTERSVRRDIERLRSLGYPVRASRGSGGGYQLGAGGALPPLLLDPDEAVAVAVCLRMAAGGTVAGVGDVALRALAKLDQVLPSRLREQVSALQQALIAIPGSAVAVDPDILLVLARACRDHTEARFGYIRGHTEDDEGRGSEAEAPPEVRRVEPYHLVARGGRWYLLAFDLDRDDWRTFRLDRMSQVRNTTWRFRPRPAVPDAASYVTDAVIRAPYRHLARVRFEAPLAQVAELVPTNAGEFVDLGADGCELQTGAMSVRWLAVHLLALGLPFTVLEPPELRDELAAMAQVAGAASARTDASASTT